MSNVDVLKILLSGATAMMTKDDALDREKAGTLRGGSCGWMSEDLCEVTGVCPRLAWARYKGFTLECNINKHQMFQNGKLSEDAVCEVLDYSWPDYKRETEVPTKWLTKNSTPVTGRPDIVLCKDTLPLHGLELKLVSSMWTALEVMTQPKTEHIIQATHYSKQLNIPYSIVYVNRTNWSLLSDFAIKKVPKEGSPGSELIEYEDYKKKIDEGGKKKTITYRTGKNMKPFYRVFTLRTDIHGQVEFFNGQQWVTTFITWDGIERYYNYIATMDDRGHCGPTPNPVSPSGDDKGYNHCKKYCHMYERCGGKRDLALDKWLKICKDTQSELLAKRINF